jgi:hypothetical protein
MMGNLRIARLLPAVVLCFGAAAHPDGKDGAAASVLHEGTPVVLVFSGSLSSKSAAKGDSVSLVLSSDIEAGGVTVAKAGDKVLGQVIDVKPAAPPGKSGALTLQVGYLQVGGTQVKLRGSKDRNGASDIQYRLPRHLKFPMGVLRSGDDVEIQAGTMVTVFVAEDVPLRAME